MVCNDEGTSVCYNALKTNALFVNTKEFFEQGGDMGSGVFSDESYMFAYEESSIAQIEHRMQDVANTWAARCPGDQSKISLSNYPIEARMREVRKKRLTNRTFNIEQSARSRDHWFQYELLFGRRFVEHFTQSHSQPLHFAKLQ